MKLENFFISYLLYLCFQLMQLMTAKVMDQMLLQINYLFE